MADNTQPNLHPTVHNYIAWVKAHEKLLVIVLGAWLAFHFYGKALDLWDRHDQRAIEVAKVAAETAAKKVDADAEVNKQLLAQLADLKQQFAVLQQQTQAAMAQRARDTDAQKHKNDNATSSELAARIATLIKMQPQEVTASKIDDTLVFSNAAAHANANLLEDGAKAQADVLDLNKQVIACTAVSKKQDESIHGLQDQLADEELSHVADINEKNREIDDLKVQKKKAWRSGFKWGFAAGVATIVAVEVAVKKVF